MNDTQTKERDNLVSLTEFKRRKRLKRKAKRNARISEQSRPTKELKQSSEIEALSWQDRLSRYVLYLCGIICALIGAAIIARNAYNQGGNDLDKWLTVGRDITCEIAGIFLVGIAIALWKESKLRSMCAWIVWVLLCVYTLQNNAEWTNNNNSNVSIERQRQRKVELENDADTSMLRKRYETAELAEKQAKAEFNKCPTKCSTLEREASKATARKESAWTEYQSAKSKADSQASKEADKVAPRDFALVFRAFVPLLSGVFLMLARR